MFMRKIIYFWQMIGCIVFATVLTACSEEVEPTPATYSQLLTGTTSKTWRLTEIQLLESGKEPTNFDVPNNCVYDDVFVFYAGEAKKFEVQEGASKCDPTDPDVFVEDTWSVINASGTINFVFPLFGGTSSIPFILKRLTERSMTVEYYNPDDNYSYRFTFTAQKD
jgi:hypothetical protein